MKKLFVILLLFVTINATSQNKTVVLKVASVDASNYLTKADSLSGGYTSWLLTKKKVDSLGVLKIAFSDSFTILAGRWLPNRSADSIAVIRALANSKGLGTVTSVTGTSPISSTGGTTPAISIATASSTVTGALTSTDWNTFNNKLSGNQTITLSGDVSGSGTTAITTTLATVNSTTGSFGSATTIPSFTVNSKGLITAASSTAVIAPAGTLTGTTLANTVVSSSLTSVGALTSGSIPYSLLTGTPTIPTNANYVDLTTAQTVGGAKLFTSNIVNGTTTTGAITRVYSSSYGNNGFFESFGTDGVSKLQMGAVGVGTAMLYMPTSVGLDVYTGGVSRFTISSAGAAQFTGTLGVTGITTLSNYLLFNTNSGAVAGSISKNATNGLTFFGVAGTTYDMAYVNKDGNDVFRNPTGTTTFAVVANQTIGGTLGVTGNTGIGQSADGSWALAITSALPSKFSVNSNATSATYGGSLFTRQTNTIGNGNGIAFGMRNASSADVEYAYIGGIIETNTAGAESGAFIIAPTVSGIRTERFRIASTGAATFSSSVTATSATFTGNVFLGSASVTTPNNTTLGMPNGANIQARINVGTPQIAMSANIDGDWYAPTYKVSNYAGQIYIDANQGSIALRTAASGTAGAAITWNTPSLYVAPSSNILINTLTDNGVDKLQVAGSGSFSGTSLKIGTQSDIVSTTGLLLGNDASTIEMVASTFLSGYGAKIEQVDPGDGFTYTRLFGRANTTSWTQNLSINNTTGAATFSSSIAATSATFTTSGTTTVKIKGNSTTGFDLQNDAGGAYLWNRDNTSMYFATNNTQRLEIASTGAATFSGALSGTSATFSGSVGIGGATNTLGFLEVWKSGSSIAQFSIGQSATYHTDMYVDASGNFYLQPQGTTALTIASTGAATFSSSVTATSFFESSDRRLKNILRRDGDVAYYTLKADPTKTKHIGYIAQEVQATNPDQVKADEKGMLSVNYIEILVQKVRDLEKRIAELENKK
jgi:hypothetical protein